MFRLVLCLAFFVPGLMAQDLVFQTPEDLVTTIGMESDLDLAIDDAGNNHIAYVFNDGNREIFYLTDTGGDWGAPQRITSSALDQSHRIARILGFSDGQAVIVWQATAHNMEVVIQRIVGGTPTTVHSMTNNQVPDVLLDTVRTGADSLAALVLRSNTVVDELVVLRVSGLFSSNPIFTPPEMVASGAGVRFLGGALSAEPDGTLHVAVRLADRVNGAIPRVAYTNDSAGAFSPLADVITDARGDDLALHVDDFDRVYLHARNATESRTKVSTDGGATFPSVVNLGSQDIWATVGRSDGIDLFTVTQIDVNLSLHAIRGASSQAPVNVPTPGWRMGDVELHNHEYRAATTGDLRFTTTAEPVSSPVGDINRDGTLDSADLVNIIDALSGNRVLLAGAMRRADLDGDLLVTSKDLMAMLGHLLGRVTES